MSKMNEAELILQRISDSISELERVSGRSLDSIKLTEESKVHLFELYFVKLKTNKKSFPAKIYHHDYGNDVIMVNGQYEAIDSEYFADIGVGNTLSEAILDLSNKLYKFELLE